MAIYLIHFATPLHHAKHYMGFTDNLEQRIEAHRKSQGARLIEVINEKGIEWEVVRVWDKGDRKMERRLKRASHVGSRYCPVCRAEQEGGV